MRKFVTLSLCLALALPVSAHAEDEEEVLPLAALGLTAAAGTASVAEGGGVLESSLMVSALLNSATDRIRTAIGPFVDGNQASAVIPVFGTAPVDLSALARFNGTVRVWREQIVELSNYPERCTAPPSPGLQSVNVDGSALGIANTLFGLMRSDVEVASVDVPANADVWINSLVSQAPSAGTSWLLLSERSMQADTVLATSATAVIATADQLLAGSCGKVDRYKAMLTQAQEQLRGLFTRPKEGGLSLYEQAAQLSFVAVPPATNTPMTKPLVLRLTVATSSGSRVTRNSIWTSLGLTEAVYFSGGLVVSYRLSDPMSGQVLTTGMIRCTTPTRGFTAIHRSPVIDAPCG